MILCATLASLVTALHAVELDAHAERVGTGNALTQGALADTLRTVGVAARNLGSPAGTAVARACDTLAFADDEDVRRRLMDAQAAEDTALDLLRPILPPRVLFLDFDGVLNHRAHFDAVNARNPQRSAKDVDVDDDSFDHACVARVTRLCATTRTAVVVSSSWRCGRTVAELRAILGRHGFRGPLVGTTPDLCRTRGLEIQAWLDAQATPPRAFAIVDDDSDMDHLTHRLVRTSFATGLLDEHVTALAALLAADL